MHWGTPSQSDFADLEQRIPNPFPPQPVSIPTLEKFPKLFDAYYKDYFGFRQPLIKLNSRIAYTWFGISTSENTILGQQGWLFYGEKNSINYYRGLNLFTLEQLQDWQKKLEFRRDWLAAQGIQFMFVIAPNKETIYSEYMPPRINRVQFQSRLDQLVTHLKTHSSINVIDLRSTLLAEKKSHQVYLKTDTHWNLIGAWAGYRAVVNNLLVTMPNLQPHHLLLSDFNILSTHQPGGDLVNFLALGDLITEETVSLQPKFTARAKPAHIPALSTDLPSHQQPQATEIKQSQLPRALVIHDSFFFGRVNPLLSEHFSRAIYIWTDGNGFDSNTLAIIAREKPNIVIHEMVERQLMTLTLQNPPEIERIFK